MSVLTCHQQDSGVWCFPHSKQKGKLASGHRALVKNKRTKKKAIMFPVPTSMFENIYFRMRRGTVLLRLQIKAQKPLANGFAGWNGKQFYDSEAGTLLQLLRRLNNRTNGQSETFQKCVFKRLLMKFVISVRRIMMMVRGMSLCYQRAQV